jgi:hypothetical protein
MPTFSTFEDCEKLYKKWRNLRTLYSIAFPIFLTVLVYALWAVDWVWVIFGSVTSMMAVFFLTSSWMVLGGTRTWKKKLSKDINAAREYATLLEYQASLVGLEPINKIEFKVKESQK